MPVPSQKSWFKKNCFPASNGVIYPRERGHRAPPPAAVKGFLLDAVRALTNDEGHKPLTATAVITRQPQPVQVLTESALVLIESDRDGKDRRCNNMMHVAVACCRERNAGPEKTASECSCTEREANPREAKTLIIAPEIIHPQTLGMTPTK